MPKTDSLQLEFSSRSDVGRVRSNNQDCCGEFSREDGLRLFVVCDGMGGHQGGALASQVAVETIGAVFERSSEPPEFLLEEALEEANQKIRTRAREQAGLEGMGTTGVALLLGAGDLAWFAHVGDSRVYRLRQGQLEVLTMDHSFVGEMLRKGQLTPEQALNHPQRNVILRSLGPEPEVRVDVGYRQIEEGDLFVLCTDGLWGEVSDTGIAAVLQSESAANSAERLVELANQNGGRDNATVQVILVERLAAPSKAPSAPEPHSEPTSITEPGVPSVAQRPQPAELPAAVHSPPTLGARGRRLRPVVGVALAAAGAAALLVLTLISATRTRPGVGSTLASTTTATGSASQGGVTPAEPSSPPTAEAGEGTSIGKSPPPPENTAPEQTASVPAAAPSAPPPAPQPLQSVKLVATKQKVLVGERVRLVLRGGGGPVAADFFDASGHPLGNGMSYTYLAGAPGKQRIRARMVGATATGGEGEIVLDVSLPQKPPEGTVSNSGSPPAESPVAHAAKSTSAVAATDGAPAGPAKAATSVPQVAAGPAKPVVASSLPQPRPVVELSPAVQQGRVGDAIPYALLNKRSGQPVDARFFVNGTAVADGQQFEFKPKAPGTYTVAARPANEPEGTPVSERRIVILAPDGAAQAPSTTP